MVENYVYINNIVIFKVTKIWVTFDCLFKAPSLFYIIYLHRYFSTIELKLANYEIFSKSFVRYPHRVLDFQSVRWLLAIIQDRVDGVTVPRGIACVHKTISPHRLGESRVPGM